MRVGPRGIESCVRPPRIRSGEGVGDRLMSARRSVVDEEACIVQTVLFIYRSREGPISRVTQ